MPHRPFARFVLAALVLVSALPAAEANDKAAEIDRLLASYHDVRQFNGSALVAEDGEVILAKGYGMAHMEWNIPNEADTRFRIGSITKQFTAMLILQLVEEGTLSLEAKLSDLLPYYRQDTGSRITLHHLLNHTSGIPSYTNGAFFREASRDPYAPQEFVEKWCSGDLEFEPGEQFRYNNSAYFILGAIIERATGESYAEVLQAKILSPLGMNGTGYDDTTTILKNRAAGYERTGDGFRNADYLDMSLPYAAGSMYSTVRDLFVWDRALYTNELLGPEMMEKFFSPGLQDYAYGWRVQKLPVGPDEAERTMIGHGGGIHGFNTLINRSVDDGNLVVLFNNTGGAPLGPINNGILDIMYGREAPAPIRPISEVFRGTYHRSGIEAATAEYHRLKEDRPDAYDLGESQLNGLGYELLADGDVEGAIAVFRFNVELFPESTNPHDSLGEALAATGDVEGALRSYARALVLDPRNVNAAEWIVKLNQPDGE